MRTAVDSLCPYLLCGLLLAAHSASLAAQTSRTSAILSATEPQPVALNLRARASTTAPIAYGLTNDHVARQRASAFNRDESVQAINVSAELDSLPQQIPIATYVVGGALAGAAVGVYLMYWHVQNCDACFFGEAAITAAGLVGAASGAVAGLIVYSFVRERARSKTSR